MLSNFFYKCFVEIANNGNISIAADKLNYSQGGLSHTINRAEEELGFKLFRRTKYGVMLTEEGRSLLPIARQVVFNMEKMDEAIASIHGLDYGHIKIGTYASISMHFLPELLVSFTRDYPGITIEIIESLANDIQNMLSEQTIDLGFTSFYASSPCERILLFDDPMVVVLPKEMDVSRDLDEDGRIPLKALQKYKFIMGMMGNRMDPDIETVFGKNLPALKTNISSLDFISIMCMVRSGLGISLLPRLITLDYQDDLQILDLSPAKYREIGMELRSVEDASAATLKLVEYVRNYTEKRFLPDHKDLGFVSRV